MRFFFVFEKGKRKSCNKNCTNTRIQTIIQIVIVFIILLLVGQYLLVNSSLIYRKGFHRVRINHLNTYDLILVKGESYRLKVMGVNHKHNFSSSNFRVAEVDFKGRIYTLQPGKTFITVKVGEDKLKCRVRVIDLNKDQVVLQEGKTKRLRVKGIVAPVKWSSSDLTIAQVSSSGKIYAVGTGTCTIWAKVKGKTLSCLVEVR